jgi:uncharacterized protein DUF6973
VSEDPLGFEGGDANLNAYVGSNPLNLRDPFGLESRLSALREIITDIFNVGPLDTMAASRMADHAARSAARHEQAGPINGPQDALRHCTWSCLMSEALGPEQAKAIADEHENIDERRGQPLGERQMDDANNKSGRCVAQPFDEPGPKKSCIDKCLDLLRNGLLFGPGGVPMVYPQR